MGKYTQKLCCCLLEYQCFRLKVVRMIGWHGGHGGGKTEVLVRKQLIFDHCAFLCISLYAPLYVTKTVHCVI